MLAAPAAALLTIPVDERVGGENGIAEAGLVGLPEISTTAAAAAEEAAAAAAGAAEEPRCRDASVA